MEEIASYIVRQRKLGIYGHRAIDSIVRLVESLELYERSGRQAQEIGVFRMLVEQTGANSFCGLGLARLQIRLRLLEELTLFCLLGNRSSPEFCRAYVTSLVLRQGRFDGFSES